MLASVPNYWTEISSRTLPKILKSVKLYRCSMQKQGVKLPFTGLSAKAEASFAKLTDTQVTDAQLELKYNFVDTLLVDVGAKAGYRILDIQLEEGSNQEAKLKFKGPYLGLEAHF